MKKLLQAALTDKNVFTLIKSLHLDYQFIQ